MANGRILTQRVRAFAFLKANVMARLNELIGGRDATRIDSSTQRYDWLGCQSVTTYEMMELQVLTPQKFLHKSSRIKSGRFCAVKATDKH